MKKRKFVVLFEKNRKIILNSIKELETFLKNNSLSGVIEIREL